MSKQSDNITLLCAFGDRCRDKESCKFVHTNICKFFSTCRKRDECQYLHGESTNKHDVFITEKYGLVKIVKNQYTTSDKPLLNLSESAKSMLSLSKNNNKEITNQLTDESLSSYIDECVERPNPIPLKEIKSYSNQQYVRQTKSPNMSYLQFEPIKKKINITELLEKRLQYAIGEVFVKNDPSKLIHEYRRIEKREKFLQNQLSNLANHKTEIESIFKSKNIDINSEGTTKVPSIVGSGSESEHEEEDEEDV